MRPPTSRWAFCSGSPRCEGPGAVRCAAWPGAEAQLRARMKAGPAWQDTGIVFCRDDGRPWNPDHVSKRFKKLANAADVPVIKFHEGGRHTGVSLMHDAEVREDISMREAGHASRDVHARYNHPTIQAH